MMRRFNSGLRKYYSGYGNQFLNAQDTNNYTSPDYMGNNMGGLQDTAGNPSGVDVTSSLGSGTDVSSGSFGSTNAPTNNGLSTAGAAALGQAALSIMPTKGKDAQVFKGLASSALGAGTLASSGTLGSGSLAKGIGAAALPVAGVAGGLLAANQVSKAIAGDQDEYGVYKSDNKGAWGGMGNIADTMGKGRDLAQNSTDYSYLSGGNSNKIKALGRVSQIPIFGTIAGGKGINRVKRLARDRTIDLNRQEQDAQKELSYSDTRQGNIDRYGTTFANGGNLGNANTSFFKAGGSTHESGGVSIGGNKEIEKNEVVYNGYVFSDRLPYKK